MKECILVIALLCLLFTQSIFDSSICNSVIILLVRVTNQFNLKVTISLQLQQHCLILSLLSLHISFDIV